MINLRRCLVLCLVLGAVLVVFKVSLTSGCKEVLCGSVVSKCLLTQSCKCDIKNCTCCKDCFICLDKLYSDCCSCVEMCPKSNDSEHNLGKNSHVEDLSEGFQELFVALTEDPDSLSRWTSYTFPAHTGLSFFKDFIFTTGYSSRDETGKIKEQEYLDINCTVAYLSQCMSWNKCKTSCTSMGASSYRWFHDGCCECVGKNCLNYGIKESKCNDCPKKEEIGTKDYEDGTPDEDEGKEGSSDKNVAAASVTSEKYSEAVV